MKVMVTGKQGQIARCLADRAENYPGIELVFAARSGTGVAIDLTDPSSIRTALETVRPDIVINAAAYTAVDQAEDEPETAMAVNGTAPGILAEEAKCINARIIQISTDYVFDGTLDRAYVETDLVNPLSVYGKSKLAGEEAVRTANSDHLIVRTAWVYSPYGKNFYRTMLNLAKTQNRISVVDDQLGTPTSAHYIADGLFTICNAWKDGTDTGLGATYHLAGPAEMTWFGFAKKIFSECSSTDIGDITVVPIKTTDFSTKAVRPRNSRLNSCKFAGDFR